MTPKTDRADNYVRAYRKVWGDDALVGMSLYAETSRCETYLDNLIADVRDAGYSVGTR